MSCFRFILPVIVLFPPFVITLISFISRPSPVCFPIFFAVILVPFVFWIAFVYLVLAFSYCAYYMVALHKLRLRCPHWAPHFLLLWLHERDAAVLTP